MTFSGWLDLPWWGVALAVLAMTHVTIAAVTIYLHRCQAHRALELHPIVSHFFRFWLWLTTGQVTKEWAAIHRKHHAKVETPDDPHSPQVHGINRVLWGGVFLYVKESHNQETLERYGHGTPEDWIERHLYTPVSFAGVFVMLALDLAAFGLVPGAIVWAVQMAWIPFWAAGVINGVGHYFGYRNYDDVADASRNIVPWGIHWRRGAAQQSPRLCLVGEAFRQVVRVRHRLALHLHPERARSCDGKEGCAQAALRRAARGGLRYAARRDRAPLRRALALRQVAQADLCA